MDAERIRAFLLTLPHVAETMQWGANLVFWAGDKAIGGKMFALVNLDSDDRHGAVISWAAGPERYSELLELDGLFPAPYLARAHWVAAQRWDVFSPAEWQHELTQAHRHIFNKLPPRTRAVLAMPTRERNRLIADRKRLLKSQGRIR
ncbi:MmcQ/YjbR family DNA-binding protein [Edaphobacter bradus]|uniref:MmcQ/YjbR family DNA-binding protein n=1 Tax=Edaphobacter bradus TaxID=2259016 RepID=UPI0021E08360|nr:MmcQ/YjbR family DNA-binding protein [Edaphobacter bradus]